MEANTRAILDVIMEDQLNDLDRELLGEIPTEYHGAMAYTKAEENGIESMGAGYDEFYKKYSNTSAFKRGSNETPQVNLDSSSKSSHQSASCGPYHFMITTPRTFTRKRSASAIANNNASAAPSKELGNLTYVSGDDYASGNVDSEVEHGAALLLAFARSVAADLDDSTTEGSTPAPEYHDASNQDSIMTVGSSSGAASSAYAFVGANDTNSITALNTHTNNNSITAPNKHTTLGTHNGVSFDTSIDQVSTNSKSLRSTIHPPYQRQNPAMSPSATPSADNHNNGPAPDVILPTTPKKASKTTGLPFDPDLTVRATPRKRGAPKADCVAEQIPIPTSYATASDADKMLLRMRDDKVPWPEIRAAWEAATGQKTAPSSLPNRVTRMRANMDTLTSGEEEMLDSAVADVEKALEREKWARVGSLLESWGGRLLEPEVLKEAFEKRFGAM